MSTIIDIPMSQYPKVLAGLQKCSEELRVARLRNLARTDLYFLLRYICGREDLEHQWIYERCKEVERSPNEHIDLWAREHYKSTIITFGKTIQDILATHGDNPITPGEWTFGIFSHSRPISVKFLSQIKQELEGNTFLNYLFPDILWENPRRDAPKWSVYAGLVVKRQRNPKEGTLEAYGLIDGMPTGGHFDVLVYDDVVTLDVVRNPDMIQKVTDSLEVSYNLGARGGTRRMIGTRYHFADTYKTVMDRGTFTPRIHQATDNGEVDGPPVLLTTEELATKRRDQGPYTFACQMMQNPRADSAQGFQDEWVKKYRTVNHKNLNIYIVCDPANEKKKRSDYTALWVIGLGEDENYYVLDVVRDRLNLTARARLLMNMHRKWKPKNVGYEKYGMQADIEHFETVMEHESYRFGITELGGNMAKNDRIKRLVPIFEQHRMWLPASLNFTDYEGKTRDLVHDFLEDEYKSFPVGLHDDMLDSMARILDEDLGAVFPMKKKWGELNYDNRGIV